MGGAPSPYKRQGGQATPIQVFGKQVFLAHRRARRQSAL